MTIDVGTVITDYSWSETRRPIITIDEKQTIANVQLGDGPDVYPIIFEITGGSKDDLADQMRGLSEVFAKAAEVLSRV
jgi:hypothetical protein